MEMYNIGVAFEIIEDGKTAPCWIHQGIRSPNLVSEDGPHKESKMGVGWPQNT